MGAEAMSDESYVGLAPCGCVRAATVIDPTRAVHTAEFCRQLIHDGLRVELWSIDKTRTARWACERCEPKLFAKQEEMKL
jgi:hypothetical protein